MVNNPAGARIGKFASVESMQFSDYSHLFDTFEITALGLMIYSNGHLMRL